MARNTLPLMLVLALVVPASGLAIDDVTQTVTDTAAATKPVVQLVLCTPDDGNDYWVDYCFDWRTTTETVTYVASARGDDPWCAVYPIPCAPSPQDPVQTATTSAYLTRLVSEVEVDDSEVCGDVWCPNICPYLGRLCASIDVSSLDVYMDGPVALADIDMDGNFDGAAVRSGGQWTYAGFCDDHTLSVSCTMTMTMEIKRLAPTDIMTICTPDGDAYWVDHCSQYEPWHLNAQRTGARITKAGDVCIIYPVPCVATFEGEITRTSVPGDVWTFRTSGETDRSELLGDVCQVGCPTWDDVREICERVSIADATLNCDLAVIAALSIAPPWWLPHDIRWWGAVNAGLMDTDGDGWAEGVAIAYLPAWAWTDTGGFIQLALEGSISYQWEYVPFACMEVDPVYLSTRGTLDCMTVGIEIGGLSSLS